MASKVFGIGGGAIKESSTVYTISKYGGSYPLILIRSGHLVELWFWIDKAMTEGDILVDSNDFPARYHPAIITSYPQQLIIPDVYNHYYSNKNNWLTIDAYNVSPRIKVGAVHGGDWKLYHSVWIAK